MALKLEKELDSGVIADYWRIDYVNFKESEVIINLYFNKDKEAVFCESIILNIDKKIDKLTDIYNKVKLVDKFKNAIDC